MLTSMIALALLLLTACSVSSILHLRSEKCIPLCFSGIVLWLYSFYCADLIRPGLWLLCGAVLCLLFLAVRKNSLHTVLKDACSPGFVVYLSLSVLFIVLQSRNQVALHDELRLWAAVPKAIHETGMRQLGTEVPVFTTVQTYPPGLPLAEFFFAAFSSEFSEGALYVGYSCFALAFLVPVFADWEKKYSMLFGPAAMILLLAPCFFTSHIGDSGMYGSSLFVDPLLGVVSGYAFAQAGRSPFRNKTGTISFGMTLAILVLCKDTGLLFAAFAFAGACMLDDRKHRLCWLLPAAFLLAPLALWRLLLTEYGIHALIPLRFHVLSREVIGNVLHAMLSQKMMVRFLPIPFLFSFVFLYGILWLMFFLAFRYSSYHSRKRTAILSVLIFGSFLGFLYGYTLIYGESLASFQRYMTTPMLCLFTVILYEVFPMVPRAAMVFCIQSYRVRSALSAVCVLVGVAVFAVWIWIYPGAEILAAADSDAEVIRAAVRNDRSDDEEARIFLVMSGDKWENSHYHHRIFFDLISSEMMIRNGLAETEIADPSLEHPAQTWAEQLKSRYNYVYILSVDEGIADICRSLAPDEPCEVGLYRVVTADTSYGVTLQRVSLSKD